jgi:hypothetical protein
MRTAQITRPRRNGASQAGAKKDTANGVRETTTDRLFKLLRRQWVTPAVAVEKVSCYSLAQRVSEWLRQGVRIEKRWVDLPSGKRVMSYRVVG